MSQTTTPGSFARALLTSESVAPRFQMPTQNDTCVLADLPCSTSPAGIGGWPEFDLRHVESEQPLKESIYSGRRADSMVIYTFAEEYEQNRAFATQYPQVGSTRQPRIRQAHSQMAVWAFCDAIGIDVPRHQWLSDERKVVVEEVGTPAEKTWPIIALPDNTVADNVNQERLRDLLSVQLLAGTEDLGHQNLKIGESGHTYVFDFDKADQKYRTPDVLPQACTKAKKSIQIINKARSEPLDIDRDTLCDRTRIIATEIETSVHRDRILTTVGRYDDVFSNETNTSFVDLFDNNISCLAT